MIYLLIILAIVLLLAGFEMLLVLGVLGLATKTIFYNSIPDAAFIQKALGGIDHATLMAIPFFIYAAQLMGSGQIARRLTGFVKALVGHTNGGMGYSVIGGSMAFGSVSGSAPATVAAMGRMAYPEMRAAGFSDKFSLGLLVASAETSLLIPPSISRLFAGGLAVGLVLGLAFAVLVKFEARRTGVASSQRTTISEKLAALKAAGWALGMPVIILGGIYAGVFTPTEAAAASVVYAIFVEAIIYRNLSFSTLVELTERSAISTAAIFILLAMGGVLSFFVTLAQVPGQITDFLTMIDAGPLTFLLIVNVCFLIAGMFIDPNSALLLLVPPLFPVATALGIDPIHFGMVVTLNIGLGMITPPFGLDIFVASSTLDRPAMSIIKGVWPFIICNIMVLMIITYVPSISLFIPGLIFGY